MNDILLGEELEAQEHKYAQDKDALKVQSIYNKSSVIPTITGQFCIGKLVKQKENKRKRKQEASTKLKDWYDMPKAELTEEAKQTIRAINLRGLVQKDKFFKKNSGMRQTQYFQLGKIISHELDTKDKSLKKSERKRKLELEILHDDKQQEFTKRKYKELSDKAEKYSMRKKKLLGITKKHHK